MRRIKKNEINIVKKLEELLKLSYCKYSNFNVAAIAIDNNDNCYFGVNVENAAYPSGLCAERSALFGSVAYGGVVGEFEEIHIMSKKDEIISPCCGCRQVMSEFMPKNARVYQYGRKGEYRVNELKELVPFPILENDIK